MGGDHGPSITIPGLAEAAKRLPGEVSFLIHGDEAVIGPELARLSGLKGRVEVRHTDQVIASDGAFIIAVDQRHGEKWVKLGRFRFDDPKGVVVRLSAQGRPGSVVADAVRFVGPYETQQ